MTRLVVPLALSLVVLTAGCLGPGGGEPAPGFEVTTLEGAAWNLTERRGSVVVLDFMATTCEPCRKQVPLFQELHHEHPSVELVSLGVGDTPDALEAWRDEWNATWVHAVDNASVSVTYGVTTLPHVVIVDKAGDITYRDTYGQAITKGELFRQVEAALEAP